MTDIVESLRSGRQWLNGGECCGQLDDSGTCAAPACIFGDALKYMFEAADEIERLRACVVAARREGIEAAAEIAKQFAIHQGDAYDIVAAIRTKLLTEGGR